MALQFNEEENALIVTALAEENFDWSSQALKPIRKKIKEYLKDTWNEQCCYCRRGLEEVHNMDIDIEHILPSSKFRNLAFVADNLNLSCTRCNFPPYKGSKTDFIVNETVVEADYKNPVHYRFIHPNFDNYEHHLSIVSFTYNKLKFTKYKQLTDKGIYTYEYFGLRKIERDLFDGLQGIEKTAGTSEGLIPPHKLQEIYAILNNL